MQGQLYRACFIPSDAQARQHLTGARPLVATRHLPALRGVTSCNKGCQILFMLPLQKTPVGWPQVRVMYAAYLSAGVYEKLEAL